MDTFITALTGGSGAITAVNLWGAVTDLNPLLLIVIPFAMGLYFVRRAVKGASKGKVKF